MSEEKRRREREEKREKARGIGIRKAYPLALENQKPKLRDWAGRGWSIEQILRALGSGSVTREILQEFLRENGIEIKSMKGRKISGDPF